MQWKGPAVLVGVMTVVLFGTATAAWAVDYPPTTVEVSGQAVSHAATQVTEPGHALPFTGGNSMLLVWIALALIAAGTFLVLRKRRTAID